MSEKKEVAIVASAVAVDLTTALRDTEKHMRDLLSSGLTREAVVVLLVHETKLSARMVNQVLNAAINLSKWTNKARR